ncbi:PilZ domain [Epibacterium ulvae]|uniref:PilZ domain n=1 Tax=Epibacterium ulvae TaxID=1156985 RepID=A0A1G5RCV6_9RHOB|nr:PilZ domain-containing protein [Epibacterium ulvae]SCZ71610.1 PilZ domain [Epibacterium ulvae]
MRITLRIVTFALFSTLAQPALAVGEVSCALFQDLTSLHISADHFLKHANSGAYPQARNQLRSALDKLPKPMIHEQLTNAGLIKMIDPLSNFVDLQERLVQRYDLSTLQKTNNLANQLSAQAFVDRIRRDIESLGCREEALGAISGDAPSGGGKGNGITEFVRRVTATEATAMSFAAIALFALGIVLMERFSSHRKRLAKRFPCAAPCWVMPHAAPEVSARAERANFVDLSQLGGKIRMDHAFEPDQMLQILVSNYTLDAKVIWCNADYIGVKFESYLSIDDMMFVLASSGNPDVEPTLPQPQQMQ